MPAQKAPAPFAAGDIAPRFTLQRADGGRFDNHDDVIAGKPMLLAFAPNREAPVAAAALAAKPDLARLDATLCVIVRQDDGAGGPDVAIDADGRLTQHCAGGPEGVALIGRNGHAATLAHGGDAGAVANALAALQALSAGGEPRPGERQAPVLLVPDVFSRADCERLIGVYNMDGNVFVEPGHGVQNRTTDYKMRIPEYGRKDRIDHWVVNPATMGLINDRLQRRLFPEIRKAFHYRITKHERYRIGCYEGERGGELHGHRDNTEPNVAHRRFACSINLNAEDFEGGALTFPEFGDQQFSPGTGEALVFSSSILHEPLHVTSGRRLVLLAFLFGDS